jgi:hypothetical protein
VSLFAAAGMTISWSPAASPVEVIDYAMDYGGQGAQVDPAGVARGIRNIIKQAEGNPVSYTLTFAHPCRTSRSRARGCMPARAADERAVERGSPR